MQDEEVACPEAEPRRVFGAHGDAFIFTLQPRVLIGEWWTHIGTKQDE